MLHYCVGHDSRAFGDHWVSGSLKGAIREPLHVLVVLLCSAYRVFTCSLLFQGSPPLSPPLYYIFYIVLFIIYPVGSPQFFQFSVTGVGAGAGTGLVAGLQLGRALGCSGCLGLGSAVPGPHVPGHPTSICDKGIN